jgi:hypothetical protein
MMPDEKKIEPHYQAQGKRLVDALFDKGFFSDTLSRDGMDAVEEFLAFCLQSAAESAATMNELTKRYKQRSENGDEARQAEETRWIRRARQAEARVAELEAELLGVRGTS